jgi:hypothetical protein
MSNPPNDPYGWNAQAAQIAANRARVAAAEQQAREGYAGSETYRRSQGQQGPWQPSSPGVPKAIKLVFLYVLISLVIIFALVLAGFFGAFSGSLSK